jgi:KDEL-tailed cysteine endopeptidase
MRFLKTLLSFLILIPAGLSSIINESLYSSHPHYESSFVGWNMWKQEYGKSYNSEPEELFRFDVWRYNNDMIQIHNRISENSYMKSMNKYGDLSPREFTEKLGMRTLPRLSNLGLRRTIIPKQKNNIPIAFDWRQKGVVNPIKDQLQCGSCWSFSAVSVIESAYAIQNGKLLSLSEQELVDCDKEDYGCHGGYYTGAFHFSEQRGLCSERDYPYTGNDDKRCQRCNPIAFVKNYTMISGVDDMLNALVNYGAIGVGIDASHLQFYRSGVITGVCSRDLNHAVTIEGYNKDVWIVRNSWGTDWGEMGYFRIAMGKNECGIEGDSFYVEL